MRLSLFQYLIQKYIGPENSPDSKISFLLHRYVISNFYNSIVNFKIEAPMDTDFAAEWDTLKNNFFKTKWFNEKIKNIYLSIYISVVLLFQ